MLYRTNVAAIATINQCMYGNNILRLDKIEYNTGFEPTTAQLHIFYYKNPD